MFLAGLCLSQTHRYIRGNILAASKKGVSMRRNARFALTGLVLASCVCAWAQGGPLSPLIVTRVALTGQTADIPTTTLFTPKADGLYRVSQYMVVTQTGGTRTDPVWIAAIAFNDDAGAEAVPVLEIRSNGTGPKYAEITTVIRANAGLPVTHTVTGTEYGASGTYEYYVTVERIQ